MNGQTTVNHPANTNEQLIGKFHVVNVDKLPINPVGNHDDITTVVNQQQQQQLPPPPPSSTADESACASRFQMIRVDRNFSRGRWKVNDYEPPENISTSTNPPVNTIENETFNISNASTLSTLPTTSTATTINMIPSNVTLGLPTDSNTNLSATLTATAASAAAAAATAFQQQQQRLALSNPATVVPTANVPPPAGLLHPYPSAALANMAAQNQPYILQNHPQFGYYPFFPPPYSHYAAQWAALAAANPYLPPPPLASHQQQTSQLSTGNLGDPTRHGDTGPDITSENPVISSTQFSNAAADHLQNAQLAAAAPFIYAAHHPHSAYAAQIPPTTSPYATIASYHPLPPPPTIIPPSSQPLTFAQIVQSNTTDIQQQQQQQQQLSHQTLPLQQQATILTSPKHDASSTKRPTQQSAVSKAINPTIAPTKPLTTTANGSNIDTLKPTPATNPPYITDLLSSSPSILNSQQPPPSLLSPITVQTGNPNNINSPNKAATASLNDIWTYSSPLNLSQAAAQTAVATAAAAMGLLNNEPSKKTEMANEIFKELNTLNTPTKQNNTTDIDNKISEAMDLVKMHLLSAVRDEVTELRQQIRTLNEKLNNLEHENAFLRQHVPSEIYAQYTPLTVGLSTINDSSNPPTTVMTTTSTIPSSQPIPAGSLQSLSTSSAQQSLSSTIPQSAPAPTTSINLPPI